MSLPVSISAAITRPPNVTVCIYFFYRAFAKPKLTQRRIFSHYCLFLDTWSIWPRTPHSKHLIPKAFVGQFVPTCLCPIATAIETAFSVHQIFFLFIGYTLVTTMSIRICYTTIMQRYFFECFQQAIYGWESLYARLIAISYIEDITGFQQFILLGRERDWHSIAHDGFIMEIFLKYLFFSSIRNLRTVFASAKCNLLSRIRYMVPSSSRSLSKDILVFRSRMEPVICLFLQSHPD